MCDVTHHCYIVDLLLWLVRLWVTRNDMTHSYVWHDSFVRVTWLIRTCDMTHSYVWHDSFIRVTWLIRTCDMTHLYVWHDSFVFVTWHDSFIRVTWLVHTSNMTRAYVWQDAFMFVTWRIHMCDMTYSYLWNVTCLMQWCAVASLTGSRECVTWLSCIHYMTNSNTQHASFVYVTWDVTCAYVW